MSFATGTKLDTRDGKVYKTVLIDGNWWLAENLAWTGAGADYADNPANRAIYGRLYIWAEFMGNIIPDGTERPSRSTWEALESFAGGASVAGGKLRTTSGWASWEPPGGNGTDEFGFKLLPAGQRWSGGGAFETIGEIAWLWSSTEYDEFGAYYFDTEYYSAYSVSNSYRDKGNAHAVRLIVTSGNIPDTAPAPSIYPASGTLQGVQLVVIQGPGTIRYTLDGSEPTASSPIYTRPFRLSSPTTVKAKAFVNPLESSTTTAILDIQGAKPEAIPSYKDRIIPLLLEQYRGDNAA